ncbi:MAG: HAMP domain-containing histidine kinase [Lentisphaerae bacterium]|nr:HAMP domain-containing histidine kinase [Lentisphaerota bacterium]
MFCIPTAIIGVSAFRLIRHEGERISEQSRLATLDRLRAIADNIRLAVSAMEEELTDGLRRIAPQELPATLLAWEKNNPLVRNIFIWHPKTGLQLPDRKNPLTAEEQRFLARYDALFSGRLPWLSAASETNGVAPAPVQRQRMISTQMRDSVSSSDSKYNPDLVQQFQTMRSSVKKLAAASDRASQNPQWSGGWIPWFTENRLSFLGWVQHDQESRVYGIELELAALLSRLITAFPSAAPEGTVCALMDGEGQIIHQAGETEIKPGTQPDLAVLLAPYLPHWQVVAYFAPGITPTKSGRGFVLLSGLLLAIFIAAILAGGALLTWQVRRHVRDALQKISFVSNISHELKTPLTSMRMYAELLSEGRVTDADKTKYYLRVIAAESQRLTRLVNNVLDFSRLEQGKKKYCRESMELTDFLRQFLEAHCLRLQEAGLALHSSIPAKQLWVQCDRDALEQVLLNLIDNATKYAAEGGELLFRLEQCRNYCRLDIMDRGPGIPAAHRGKIFEKFYRVDDSLTTRQPGSGLGLSIARRLLRDLGGDLTFEPRAGGGSCFVVRLPCAEDPRGPPENDGLNT